MRIIIAWGKEEEYLNKIIPKNKLRYRRKDITDYTKEIAVLFAIGLSLPIIAFLLSRIIDL